jgi:hypothetical protein
MQTLSAVTADMSEGHPPTHPVPVQCWAPGHEEGPLHSRQPLAPTTQLWKAKLPAHWVAPAAQASAQLATHSPWEQTFWFGQATAWLQSVQPEGMRWQAW